MEEDILDIIYKIQEARSPRTFIWNIIKKLKISESKYDKNISIFKIDDKVYFNYVKEENYLMYSLENLQHVIEKKYNLNEYESRALIKEVVRECFNNSIIKIYPERTVWMNREINPFVSNMYHITKE
jgi:hypothetical protein